MTIARRSPRLTPLARAVRIVPIVAAIPAAASAATVVVDSADGYADAGSACSIVDAVDSLNAGMAVTGCSKTGPDGFGTNDTIDLTGFQSPTDISLLNAAFALALTVPARITGDVGPNSVPFVTITRTNYDNFRLLESNRNLAIDGVAFQKGFTTQYGGAIYQSNAVATLSIANSLISGNFAFGGGGIASRGPVTITDTIVTGNTAGQNGGGGVNMLGGAPLSLIGAIITDNQARSPTVGPVSTTNNSFDGGGVRSDGNVVAVGTLISGNTSTTYGGGIFTNAHVQLTGSTVSANTAGLVAGGLFAFGVTADKSTISGNRSLASGGGAVAQQVEMLNSTVSGNSALAYGGMYAGTSVSLAFTTVAGNVANSYGIGLLIAPGGQATMTGALLYGNHYPGTSKTNDLAQAGSGNVIILVGGSYNLVGTSAGVIVPLDTLSCNPVLMPLADNGGPTQTMALSPNVACAIDMGPASTNLATTDQRGPGFPRKSGRATDIGAYEYDPADRIFYDGFDE